MVGLSFLAGGALLLVLGAVLLASTMEPRVGVVLFGAILAGGAVGVVLVGRYLIRRYVIQPMGGLTEAADRLGAGNLAVRAPAAESREFTELAEQFNQMTDRLLDAQSQLVRAEKLAGIGRLAAGIAHEVGNPLSAIGTYLDVWRKRGADPDVIASISRETERIDRIVRSLLEYARPREDPMQPLDLGAVARSALELLKAQGVLKQCDLRTEIDSGLPAVRGQFHALEQVAVNLVLNAADAAPGGTISVGVMNWRLERISGGRRNETGDHSAAREQPSGRRPWRPEIPEGSRGVLLVVSDSGPGVPPDDRERVFDPFFTTKPPGAGTGLGLAIVQRTVHESGGIVWVDSAREGGAAFKLFLPGVES